MTKPIFFCDFDGVINAFPQKEVWVGPEDSKFNGFNDFELMNPKNWDIVPLTPDLTKTFPIDKSKIINEENSPIKRELLLRWSSELVENIRNLIISNKIDFIWLTTWKEYSQTVLNPLLDFPDDTPYLNWYRRRSDYNDFGKYEALHQYLEDNPENKKRPIIWVDDVATKSYKTFNVEEPEKYLNEDDEEYPVWKSKGLTWLESNTLDHLVIQSEIEWGINLSEWAAIKEFVEKHNK